MLAKLSTFYSACLCPLIQTKRFRQPTWSQTSLELTLRSLYHKQVFWTSLPSVYINIFKRRHHKNHQALRASFLLLQITSANIYPVASVCNLFNFSQSLQITSTTVAWIMYLNFTYCIEYGSSSEANRVSSGRIPPFLWKPKDQSRFYKSPPPVTILSTVAWLQPEMEGFSFWQRWEQNLMLSFMIWNHRWLLTFLSIAILLCTASLKCRYFRNYWNTLQNYIYLIREKQ